MDSSKFKPDRFKTFLLHRAAASGCIAEVQQQLAKGANPYQPTQDGWTALHAAVANKAESIVDLLLSHYEKDWQIIRDTIRHRFLWKTEQSGWKTRPTLLAWTDAECQETMAVASSCPAGIPLNLQVFVLLQSSQQGHRFVALDVCNRSKWLNIVRLIQRLLPNGVLSLDRSDLRHDVATYLQLACSVSTKEIIVKLINKGALLTVASGYPSKTPFMVAVEKMRKDVIDLLMEKHVDRFDPYACDENGYNALHLMMQRQHVGIVEQLLKCFLHHRTVLLRETEPQALSRILWFESPEYSFTNIWNFVRSVSMKKLFERYIMQGKFDIRSRVSGGTTTLATLLTNGIALKYCFSRIEENLDLLLLQNDQNKLNVLHTLIQCKKIGFVEALYRKHGSLVKEYFEADDPDQSATFELLRLLIHNADERGVAFVLKYHREFYTKDLDKFRRATAKPHYLNKDAYGKLFNELTKAVPELQVDLEQSAESEDSDFYDHLRKLWENFPKTASKLEADGKRLDDYHDKNRRTFLHAAVAWGYETVVEKLLKRNVDVMRLDAEGNLPISLVYRSNSIFHLLLDRNEPAQLSFVNGAGYNLLHIGSKNGLHETSLAKLLEHGLDVNGPAPDGQLPLSLASCCGTVSYLLDHGARVDLLNEELLRASLRHMHYCAAVYLIPNMAHLHWFRKCAHMYLSWMVGGQTRDFLSSSVQDFLEGHADIRRMLFDSLYEHSRQETAELFAKVCHAGIICCVKWFLECGYDIDYNHRYQYESTPLLGLLSYIGYCMEGHFEVVHELLRKSIDVNAADDQGRNALLILASRYECMTRYGHAPLSTVRLLMERGSRLDEQDDKGNTALHYAFEQEQWEFVEFLIEHGANPSIKNQSGKRACEMASVLCRNLFGFVRG